MLIWIYWHFFCNVNQSTYRFFVFIFLMPIKLAIYYCFVLFLFISREKLSIQWNIPYMILSRSKQAQQYLLSFFLCSHPYLVCFHPFQYASCDLDHSPSKLKASISNRFIFIYFSLLYLKSSFEQIILPLYFFTLSDLISLSLLKIICMWKTLLLTNSQ